MSDTDISSPKPRLIGTTRSSNETAAPAGKRSESTLSPIPAIAIRTRGANALAPAIDIDRLYDSIPGTSSQMVRALELLKQASDDLARALQSENPMESDRHVQRAQLMLPKLFALRSIGDGFGLVINSLYFAFTNLHGTPLAPNQLNVVWRVIRELRARPVLSLEQGIQRVEDLEESGLTVDPPDLGNLLEELEPSANE
jgi:hypothetical protein